ncbi:MAG: fibronectin type III domain-containing protein [Bacteroidales bacterium]|nr:fibronectin type III domain-containing protein [Bacteroidales bacterium]
MKKSLFSLILLCFACFGVARAQNTVTVCDGTETSQYIPVYAYSGDTQGTTSEFIIPATESGMSDMTGKAITSMSFYVAQNQSKTWTAVYKVYMAEVNYTTLSANIGPNNGTVVYTGTLDASGAQMTIEFDDAYTYNGGNLLIGTYVQTAGAWDSNGQFYGVEAADAAYMSGDWNAYQTGAYDFIPKATFTYEKPSSCYKPQNLQAQLTIGNGTIATLTWERNVNGTEEAWVLEYGTASDFTGATSVNVSRTPSVDLTGLTPETTYYARVKPDCDTDGTKWSNTCTFTPTNAMLLTVNDGTNKNSYVPIYGYWCDNTQRSEFIVPASSLTAMNGYAIASMKFYASYGSAFTSTQSFKVYLSEVSETAFSGTTYYTQSNATIVYDGTLTVSTTEMTITFDEEYVYGGGNLLIGFYKEATSGNYSSSSSDGFYGVTANGASISNYSSNSASQRNFLPKVTFELAAVSSCQKPKNLQANEVSTNSALLSWTGDNDSYVLQYRTAAMDTNMGVWEQQGNDIEAPGEFTQLTFDLSDYSGTGYIAIRHYACSGQWQMTIDDVVVTNANNETVFTEDFNSGSFPSSCINLDYDGDGNLWQIANFGDDAGCQHGAYCLMSASYSNSEDLYPDNWFIIPNVALGGTLTFYVASTDASWPENFGVFVATSSYEGVPAGAWSSEIPVATTSYDLTGLTANTAYEWQVKGICNDYPDPSNWASSSFTTIPEGFKTFVTEGNWDVANNWYPVGVPAITDEVSIEAPVTIPAGVVATAKKATINGGSVLIKDGGQLKQGSYTLKVTMEKDITGYGESTNDHYYFIATPLTGTTQLGYTSSWNYVTNVNVGDYDFYWFDASVAHEEWQNYKAHSSDFVMNPGEGYLYANKVDKQLQFVGTTKGYNIPTTIDFAFDGTSTTPFNGWSLVGNPYSCNAYLSYVDANDVALDADFYTLNNDNTYTLMSSSTPLAPCTGALINYSATGKVQYSTEPTNSKGSMLNMTVSEGRGTVDQVRVRFGQGHNLKHMSFRNNSKLYMPVEGNDYAVVYAENEGEMPVSFKAEKNGNYTISFSNENVEFGYLHLIDNMTGADIDLLETPSYSFDAKVTDYASRFKLVFAAGSNNNDSFAFYNNGNIVINNEGSAIVNIVDVLGRTISSQTINGSENVSINAKAGVYTLQLIQGEKVMTQKIVIE